MALRKAASYNVVDDEAPDFATLFASAGAPPPDGSNGERRELVFRCVINQPMVKPGFYPCCVFAVVLSERFSTLLHASGSEEPKRHEEEPT